MKRHKLKIENKYHERTIDGSKLCEIRKNDRDYQVGDEIVFKTLWTSLDKPAEARFEDDYLIHETPYRITHVLHFPEGLKDGYVALSIEEVEYNRKKI